MKRMIAITVTSGATTDAARPIAMRRWSLPFPYVAGLISPGRQVFLNQGSSGP